MFVIYNLHNRMMNVTFRSLIYQDNIGGGLEKSDVQFPNRKSPS